MEIKVWINIILKFFVFLRECYFSDVNEKFKRTFLVHFYVEIYFRIQNILNQVFEI